MRKTRSRRVSQVDVAHEVRSAVPVRGLCVPCAGAQRRACALSVVVALPVQTDGLVRDLMDHRWLLVAMQAPVNGSRFAASAIYCEDCARAEVGSSLVDAAFAQYKMARVN